MANLRDRLNFRQNWPLLGAGGLLLIGVIFIFSGLPFLPSYGTVREEPLVFYPVIVFSSATVFILLVFSLISLLILGVHAFFKQVSRSLFLILIVLGLFFSLIASLIMNAILPFGAILIISVIFGITGTRPHPDEINSWIPVFRVIGVVLSATILFCNASLILGFNRLLHKEAVQFGQYVFNLAINQEADMDCITRRADVYQCDSMGLLCRSVYSSKSYYECSSVKDLPPGNVNLLTVQNALFLQLGKDEILIAQ